MCGMLHFMVQSSGPHLSTPGPSVTIKCLHPHPRLFIPALPGIWLLRNGCTDCKSRCMVALPWKYSVRLKFKKKNMYGNDYNKFKCYVQGFSFLFTWADHDCSSALPLKERLRMWFLNCSISSGFCCWICCANCCPLAERWGHSVYSLQLLFYQK